MSSNDTFMVHRLVLSEFQLEVQQAFWEIQFWIRKNTSFDSGIDDGYMVIQRNGTTIIEPWVITKELPYGKQQSNSYISHEPLSLNEMRWAWNTLKEQKEKEWLCAASS